MIKTVPTDSTAVVEVITELTHKCPFVDEVDYGGVRIQWRCAGETFELHALAEYLSTAFVDTEISHEDLVTALGAVLDDYAGVTDVRIEYEAETAGLDVRVATGADALFR